MSANVPLLSQVFDKLFVSLIVTVAGGLLVWPFKAAKSAVKAATDRLTAVEAELVVQRTNCLSTIQKNTETTNTILERVADTLEKTHDEQVKMSGYIQGMSTRK